MFPSIATATFFLLRPAVFPLQFVSRFRFQTSTSRLCTLEEFLWLLLGERKRTRATDFSSYVPASHVWFVKGWFRRSWHK